MKCRQMLECRHPVEFFTIACTEQNIIIIFLNENEMNACYSVLWSILNLRYTLANHEFTLAAPTKSPLSGVHAFMQVCRGDGGASEKQLQALAIYMGHSVEMQRNTYDRRSKAEKVGTDPQSLGIPLTSHAALTA